MRWDVRRPRPLSAWEVRALALAATACTFGVALALMPRELALFDEKHVLWQIRSYGWLEVARNLMRDSHPPLYYWLAKGWWELGGFEGPWAYRAFSILLGLLAVPLAFQVGRRWGGPWLGLALVAMGMLNPFYLFLLVLIRMYGLVIALGALLTLLWTDLMRRPTPARWAAWVLVQGALMFTHYYGLLLIGAQWLTFLLRRPRGWWGGALASLPLMGAFGGWLAQAYGGSLEHTAQTLAAIPVRPMPWEVLGNLWATLLVGPFADGRLAAAIAAAAGAVLGRVGVRSGRSPRWQGWGDRALVALLPLGMGALIAIRWPFFAARYFAMSVVPVWALMAACSLNARLKWSLLVWILPGLIGVARFPVFNIPLIPVGLELEFAIDPLIISEPVLVQARWHIMETARSYDWSDPSQRAQVLDRSPSFWFIGVTIYRGNWEGWLRDLGATHLIDFQAEFPHSIPEYGASVFHLVRRAPVVRWADLGARWANGIRLHAVGWTQEVVTPGHSVQWQLRLSTDRPLGQRWTLFIHLVDERGRLWANWDAEPDPPTDRWVPGQVYDIGRSLWIPPFTPAGRYRVQIGWYPMGTAGFPRLPLFDGGEVLPLGWVALLPDAAPAPWGLRSAGQVELQLPRVFVRPAPEGARVWVQFRWRARAPAAFDAWEVTGIAPSGPYRFQRAYTVPAGAENASGWVTELWVSPVQPGSRPALQWVEIRYAGQLVARHPVWVFPPSVSWSYDWVFLNRNGP